MEPKKYGAIVYINGKMYLSKNYHLLILEIALLIFAYEIIGTESIITLLFGMGLFSLPIIPLWLLYTLQEKRTMRKELERMQLEEAIRKRKEEAELKELRRKQEERGVTE